MKTRVELQTTTSSHVRVRHPLGTCSFTSFSASVSTLNQQIFTYFVQRRSFLRSCYHFNIKQAFKVNNLVPMTMQHGRCHWSRALWQVSGRACSCKKDPCSNSLSEWHEQNMVIVRHLEKYATWYRWPRDKASQKSTHGGGALGPNYCILE